MCSSMSFFWDPTVSVQFINLSVEVLNIVRNIYFSMWLKKQFYKKVRARGSISAFMLNKNLFDYIAYALQKTKKKPHQTHHHQKKTQLAQDVPTFAYMQLYGKIGTMKLCL